MREPNVDYTATAGMIDACPGRSCWSFERGQEDTDFVAFVNSYL
ncbi:hypothetical protein [Halosegnis sp.]